MVENINALKKAGTPFRIYYNEKTNAPERPSFNGGFARTLMATPTSPTEFVLAGVLPSTANIQLPELLLNLLSSELSTSNANINNRNKPFKKASPLKLLK